MNKIKKYILVSSIVLASFIGAISPVFAGEGDRDPERVGVWKGSNGTYEIVIIVTAIQQQQV